MKPRAVVSAVIAEAVRAGTFPPSAADERESAAASLAQWSALHGLTLLVIDDLVGPPAAAETLVEPVIGALIDGLALRPRALPAGVWVAPRV